MDNELEFMASNIVDFLKYTWSKGGQGMTLGTIDNPPVMASPHPMTGAFESSIRYEIEKGDNSISINFYGLEYGVYLRDGVHRDRIKNPKAPARIDGLYKWVKAKLGVSDDREALSIAYAIAQTHAAEGFPWRDDELGSRWMDKEQEDREALNELTLMIRDYLEKNIKKLWQL